MATWWPPSSTWPTSSSGLHDSQFTHNQFHRHFSESSCRVLALLLLVLPRWWLRNPLAGHLLLLGGLHLLLLAHHQGLHPRRRQHSRLESWQPALCHRLPGGTQSWKPSIFTSFQNLGYYGVFGLTLVTQLLLLVFLISCLPVTSPPSLSETQ